MAPLFVLAVGFAVLRGLGLAGVEALDTWQLPLRGGLAAMLLLTASAHFGSRRRDLVAPAGGTWWPWCRLDCPGLSCS